MNYEQFVRGEHAKFQALSETVANIIQAAIDDSPENFRLQQITARAKSQASLHRKLTERGLVQSESIENELKDLAGCRLIFYTNTDVDRFLDSRLIFENLNVDFDGSNIHHAVGKHRSADELYFAIHYLVSLKPDRLALPEFRKFAGMRCEVQIQTILNHAWAETSHDILYHRPSIKGFGTKQFQDIEKRLTRIMNEFLLPAGYEFQKVQHDFERLMEGKEVFERGAIEELEAAKNNNDRYNNLRRIQKLLPYYDDVIGIAPELLRSTVCAMKEARSANVLPIETPFGNIDGHTYEQVMAAAIEIIENIQYVDVQSTFRALCELYVTASDDDERRRLLQSVDKLSHNDFHVWHQVGFAVQKLLYEDIAALKNHDREKLRPILVTVCRQILDPEISGTTWHANSVSLHQGVVPASEAYGALRRSTLDLLFRLYGESKDDGERRNVIQALNVATQFPGDAAKENPLRGFILDDTRRVVEFFSTKVSNGSYEILQSMEHHFLWLYRRSKGLTASNSTSEMLAAQKVISAIETFRDRLNNDPRYVLFKTLVGYDSVFPIEWDGDSSDIEGEEAYRAARVAEYVESVSDANADEWYENILLCASIESTDGATFLSFIEFLRQLSERQPMIVLRYLEKDNRVLSGFLPTIFDGLAKSNQKAAVVALMNAWADRGNHLPEIARCCRIAAGVNRDLVRKVGRKAIEAADPIAAIESIAAAVGRAATDLIQDVFVPAVCFLSTVRDSRWVNVTWFLPELKKFLLALSEKQAGVVLENLLHRVRIGHHDERILAALAVKYPRSVWLFFKGRIDQKTSKNADKGYEAIPFELHDLTKPLALDAKLAVQVVRGWYSPDDHLFTYEGGRLLHTVFPSLGEKINVELIDLVKKGTDDDVNFVLRFLRAYQGGVFLHPVCKEIVNRLSEDDDRLETVEAILDSTGVLAGQFGFVEAFQNKQAELTSWLSDDRPNVCRFAEKHSRSLSRRIASEQRRSEANYELRQREWPDGQ